MKTSKFQLALILSLAGIALAKPKERVIIKFENDPDYVPYQKVNFEIKSYKNGSEVGLTYSLGHHVSPKESVYKSRTDVKQFGTIWVEFYFEEKGNTKIVSDTVNKFLGCEVIYRVSKNGQGQAGVVTFHNDSLSIQKQWNKDCED